MPEVVHVEVATVVVLCAIAEDAWDVKVTQVEANL
jgi:hypothetical protein